MQGIVDERELSAVEQRAVGRLRMISIDAPASAGRPGPAASEAAVIRSRLDAGVYGPKRRRRSIAYAGAAIGALIALFLLL